MSEVYKRLAAVEISSASTNTLLYSPSSPITATLVSSLNVCNKNNVSIVFRIAHVVGNLASLTGGDWFYYNVTLTAYDTFEITRGITMSTNDTLAVWSDTTLVNFTAWGSEMSS